jgi:hypothetical protein
MVHCVTDHGIWLVLQLLIVMVLLLLHRLIHFGLYVLMLLESVN